MLPPITVLETQHTRQSITVLLRLSSGTAEAHQDKPQEANSSPRKVRQERASLLQPTIEICQQRISELPPMALQEFTVHGASVAATVTWPIEWQAERLLVCYFNLIFALVAITHKPQVTARSLACRVAICPCEFSAPPPIFPLSYRYKCHRAHVWRFFYIVPWLRLHTYPRLRHRGWEVGSQSAPSSASAPTPVNLPR